MDMVPTPRELLEQMADLRFDPEDNERLQILMDRNNFGELTEAEQKELARYVALNQRMSIIRGQAMLVLGRKFE
jgi:hypothetical protein